MSRNWSLAPPTTLLLSHPMPVLMSGRQVTVCVKVRSRTVVLERAREGLGRDLDNLSEEARLLREAREELARCLSS